MFKFVFCTSHGCLCKLLRTSVKNPYEYVSSETFIGEANSELPLYGEPSSSSLNQIPSENGIQENFHRDKL